MSDALGVAALHILVVDDEPSMRRVLQIMLERMGHTVVVADDGVSALTVLESESVDLVISDLRMPRLDGLGLQEAMRERQIAVPLIMISAHGSIDTAVAAMRLGALDFLQRPFDREALALAIARVMQQGWLLRQNRFLREAVASGHFGLIGESASMQEIRKAVAQVGPTTASVLLTGETGTGKEVVAQALHDASERRDRLFVPINCAAIPADMLESELFGHVRGAFTGAVAERVGRFELSSGGTLFLDEITEMPAALQAKLLRVLQASTVERLGSNQSRKLDLRIVAASNRDPAEAVAQGRLRADLLYRLDVFRIQLPPLRERPEDIPLLVRHFLSVDDARAPLRISAGAEAQLQAYAWPGNVRELRNVCERARIVAGASTLLEVPHFGLAPAAPARVISEVADPSIVDFDLEQAVSRTEQRYLRAALAKTDRNKTQAAALLGISERTLWYKLKRHQLRDADDTGGET